MRNNICNEKVILRVCNIKKNGCLIKVQPVKILLRINVYPSNDSTLV